WDTRSASPLRQLQLDAAVATKGFPGLFGIDRLELAQAPRDQPLRGYAPGGEGFNYPDRGPRPQPPVFPEIRAGDAPPPSMAVDAQHPGDLARNLLFEFEQRDGEPVEFGETLGLVERRPGGVEEHFRLEHEAIADDADVGSIAENHPQPPEEVGTVAREFL